MSRSFVTPLRYPGGKARLGAWLAEIIGSNNLEKGRYVEPYAGGAGAAMFLLANNHIESVLINDIDPIIYSFWWSVLNDTGNFLSLVEHTPLTIDEWHRQREVVINGDTRDPTTLGFAAFYQNRTNRSGIIKGGVIGGLRQDGKYKLDARFNRQNLALRIRLIANLASRIELTGKDALKLISDSSIVNDKCSLMYLDPPYYNKGSQLYRNSYDHDEHIRVSLAVKEIQAPWVVTYDNCPEVHSMYAWASKEEFSMKYSTHLKRPMGQEVCFHGNLKNFHSIYLKR